MNTIDIMEALSKVGSFFIPFLFSLCFHEYAHGWVALRKGDNTALLMGRLSLNPIVHMDIIGTLFLPLMALFTPGLPLFGWAKPVPVNVRNLSHPKKDMFWIALAGPLSNVLLAFLGVFALLFITILYANSLGEGKALREITHMFILINLFLATFNMIPLHPLDGAKVFARFFPVKWNEFLEEKAMTLNIILILLIIFGGISYLAKPVFWLYQFLIQLVFGIFRIPV